MSDTSGHDARFHIESEGMLTVEFVCRFDPDDEDKPCAMWDDPTFYNEDNEEYEPQGFIPGCGLLEWYEAEPSIYPEMFGGVTVHTDWFPIRFTWIGEDGIESWEKIGGDDD